MIADVEEIRTYIEERFPQFGINKRRQIIRLLYEIRKREQCHLPDLLHKITEESQNFSRLKSYLLARRFPTLTETERNSCHDLPELDINPESCTTKL